MPAINGKGICFYDEQLLPNSSTDAARSPFSSLPCAASRKRRASCCSCGRAWRQSRCSWLAPTWRSPSPCACPPAARACDAAAGWQQQRAKRMVLLSAVELLGSCFPKFFLIQSRFLCIVFASKCMQSKHGTQDAGRHASWPGRSCCKGVLFAAAAAVARCRSGAVAVLLGLGAGLEGKYRGSGCHGIVDERASYWGVLASDQLDCLLLGLHGQAGHASEGACSAAEQQLSSALCFLLAGAQACQVGAAAGAGKEAAPCTHTGMQLGPPACA